jgi:peptidoglycan/xylan/chitin deacetylase (PgdA/CDA1 family)
VRPASNDTHAVVLMYHRVDLAGARPEEGDFALPTSLFTQQLAWLAAARRPVVSLAQLASGEFEDGAVVLTFDDGCDSDTAVALPRLVEAGFPASFFVNPATVGERGRLGWPELERLVAAGMRVGSHGLDHTLLDGLPAGEVERQLDESRRILEMRLGTEVDALSLPGGTGGRVALDIARSVGYRIVLGSRPGRVAQGHLPVPVPRYPVRRRHGLEGFRAGVEQRLGFRLLQATRYRALHALRAAVGSDAYVRWARWRAHRRQGFGSERAA